MEKLTPAMKQYMEIKGQYKDCIVFFRMGDFYETFFEDAKITSKTLDIALTRRGMKNSQAIPLAGIPYHALDSYLSKMIKHGHKVVIVEQLENPKDAKGVVKRGVIRVVTPGTVIEEKMLDKENNFIASIYKGEKIGLSFVDASTGEFFATESESMEKAIAELVIYEPKEVILPMSMEGSRTEEQFRGKKFYLTFRNDFEFYFDNARACLKKHFGVMSLDGFGLKRKENAVSSAGAMLSYLQDMQKSSLSHINTLKYYSDSEFLAFDSTTANNLEIINSREKPSLLKVLDKTLTPMGLRLLKKSLLQPLRDLKEINQRLSSVEELIKKNFVLEETRDLLKNVSDIERLISRINYGNSNPRDLVSLQGSLELIPQIKKYLAETDADLLSKLSEFESLSHVAELIDEAISDDAPANTLNGGFIREGYNEELDRLREISRGGKKLISQIEDKERESTGIKSLKIRYNKIFGYYIDVTKTNLNLVPDNYIKKQTLVSSERFITEELKKLEEDILTSEEKRIVLEQNLFGEIEGEIKKETKKIQDAAEKIAYVDMLCSFAKVSIINNYRKPSVDEEYKLVLEESRHPVIEQLTDFVANDVLIGEKNRTMIITGPNMAGKSIYLKQAALNIIMAQAGCFVPAKNAEIGIIDKIFFRTGASDDISKGQSTFMVEMSDTAQILNSATERSLILLDEIGRGTSTYDGVAIAWSVAEYITKKIKAKTLFATHYHVLNNLEKELSGVKNYNIAVEEKEDKILFLRKIIEGGTDKSYGIHVAKLAGMPKEVISRSREIQFRLEQDDDISEKIIIESRKTKEKDILRDEVEEVDRLIKSKQMRLDEL